MEHLKDHNLNNQITYSVDITFNAHTRKKGAHLIILIPDAKVPCVDIDIGRSKKSCAVTIKFSLSNILLILIYQKKRVFEFDV